MASAVRRLPGPRLECAVEGVGVFKAEQEGNLAAGHLGAPQVVACQVFPRCIDQRPKVCPLVFEATLQRALEWPRAEVRIIALVGERIARLACYWTERPLRIAPFLDSRAVP